MPKLPVITLGIKRLPATDEWKVTYKEGSRYLEGPTDYASYPEDAAGTVRALEKRLNDKGYRVKLTRGAINILEKYPVGVSSKKAQEYLGIEE